MAALTLHERIATFIERGEGDVELLALEAYAAQCAASPLLAALCAPTHPNYIDEIPALPVALFKELDLGPAPALPGDVVFRTSGTTGQTRGVRRCRNTRLYDLGAVRHIDRCISHRPTQILSLCPTDLDSSLAHMLRAFGSVVPAFTAAGVDAGAWKLLAGLAATGPVFVAATAFALDGMLSMPGTISLTDDSLIMVTGGFKGRDTRLDAPEMYRILGGRFGAPRVVGQYGMTELSSQLWTSPVSAGQLPGAFVAPPWLKVRAADPHSGRPVDGPGVLRFVDLANLGGVVAIETQDLGVVESRAEGDHVTLLGRLAGAELRGCSLRAEAARARLQ